MKRALRILCCAACVVAGESRLVARDAIFENVPVPGGAAALAKLLAIDPVPDRGRYMFELTRLIYDTTEVRSPAVAAFLQAIRQPQRGRPSPLGPTSSTDVVPVPLTADVWADAIFRRRVTREELVAAIIADRSAALICNGLLRLDDETLEYFSGRHGLLSRLYERSAPIFAAFAGSIQVRDGRVVPPGGDDAAALWEAVVGEKVTRADRFLQLLFEVNDGRLAYLYDTIGQLDPPHRAFALGMWLPAATRLERFKVLAIDGLANVREWHVRVMPFGRSSYDLAMLLMRLAVSPDGAPAAPASRGLWGRVFNGQEAGDDQPVDAAWLAVNVVATDVRQRGERVDQIGYAQRTLGSPDVAAGADAVLVLRSIPRFRALIFSFERAGIRNPVTLAAVLRHATRLNNLEGRRGYVVHAQFQGALVLVARMRQMGTIDVPTAERLLERLVASPVSDGSGYGGGVARWLRADVHPVLPASRDIESALIAGLAGRPIDAAAIQRVTWEGQRYRLDLTGSEQNRLRRVREKQAALAIDLPLQLAEAARTLASPSVTMDDVKDGAAQFTALLVDVPQRTREEEADNVPAGVGLPPPPHDVLKKAASELTQLKDLKRAARLVEPIVELADDLLARSLLSFAYAISIGDPEGTVLLADDVSHRHDFGFALKDNEQRTRLMWAVPRQEVAPNVPWHVSGSLLGLDVALSTLTLRRVSTDHVLEAPKLTSNARDTFATSVALIDPLALRDRDRDAIATAINGGQVRIAGASATDLDAMASELSLDPARLRTLRWTLQHDRPRLPSLLSLTELLVLGGGRTEDLHPWGMGVTATSGCFCSRVLAPGAWLPLAGRPQLGLSTAILPDVNFRIAMLLRELNLPAALARVVLSAAIQDFIDEVRPTDDGDWLSLSRAARAITRERVEDYIAAATATGPLLPDAARSPEFER